MTDMNTHNQTGLYWFRHDLRLHDQPALDALATQCDKLICLYIVDPEWFSPTPYGTTSIGRHRQQFLFETLESLNTQLQSQNQLLHVVVGRPVEIIQALIKQHQVSIVGIGECNALNSSSQAKTVSSVLV